jgi:ABC-type polysaccharide/polyol phosphate export permease
LTRLPGRLFLGNLLRHRTLLWQLVRRDFHQRYVGSAAGWLWSVVHPAVLLGSWTFLFEYILKQGQVVTARGVVTQHYTLFLLAGYLPWFLFQETVQRSANSLVEQSSILTKTVFPSELLAISIFLSTLVNHLVTLALVMLSILYTTGGLPWHIVALPPYLFITGLLSVGLGWIASSLQVYLRDVAQAVQVGLTLWFWLTPIFVFEEQYPAEVRLLLQANPIALLVRVYRSLLLEGRWPALGDTLLLVAVSATVFVLGGLIFRHLKRGFADVL